MEPTNATTVTQPQAGAKSPIQRKRIPKLTAADLTDILGVPAPATVLKATEDDYFLEILVPVSGSLGNAPEISHVHQLVTDLQSQADVGAVRSFNVETGKASIVMELAVKAEPENSAAPLRSAITSLSGFSSTHQLAAKKATWKYRINGTIVFGPTPFQ